MAVILVDGFELYNGISANTGLQSKWTASNTAYVNVVSSGGRFGSQGVYILGSQAGRINRAVSGVSEYAVGFAAKFTDYAAAGSGQIRMRNGTTVEQQLYVDDVGAIRAYRGTTNLGTSAAGVIQPSVWHYIEFEVVISNTVGVFNVYVDSQQVLNITGADTLDTNSTVNDICLGNWNNVSGTWYIDDVYMTDTATRLGERRVTRLNPTSDVAQGFTRSAGSDNYALVDDGITVDGDTTYVQSDVLNTVDTYGFADLTGTPDTIDAVNFVAFAEKTDTGARSIALQAKSGVTTSDGSSFALGGSYSRYERLMTVDPDTSSAWTASGVNALQGGPKVTV